MDFYPMFAGLQRLMLMLVMGAALLIIAVAWLGPRWANMPGYLRAWGRELDRPTGLALLGLALAMATGFMFVALGRWW